MMYNRVRIGTNTRVRLTEAGKDAHDAQIFDGTDKGEILIYLNDYGASRVFAIAQGLAMNNNHAVRLVSDLLAKGYVTDEEELTMPEI